MKTIKAQIRFSFVSLTIVLCLVFGIVSAVLNYSSTVELLEETLTKTSEIVSDQIAMEIEILQNIAVQAGMTARLSNVDLTIEEKEVIVQRHADTYDVISGNLLDVNGDSYFDGNNYSETEYFKEALKGNIFISDPTVSKTTGKVSFVVAAPIWEAGLPDTEIVGVVYFVPDANFLNEIVSKIVMGETGSSYILNEEGVYVAAMVDGQNGEIGVRNNINESKTDKTLENIAEIEKEMIAGKNGFGTFFDQGSIYVQGYAPIANTNGWSVGVFAQQKDFMGGVYLSLVLIIALVVIFIFGGILYSSSFAKRLSKPIIKCNKRISLLGQGDLQTVLESSNNKDEIGELQNTTVMFIGDLQDIVIDITNLLSELAKCNLAVSSQFEYKGDFLPIGDAIEHITNSLNKSMGKIGDASLQVELGAERVSIGSKKLAEGASEQSSAIEELATDIILLTEQIRSITLNAVDAHRLSESAEIQVELGNEKMNEVTKAMGKINETSTEIARIIQTIDSIASQTNMLALNAAIEAARVGAAGAGFAVVSDQIGLLAVESTKAARSTADLIKDTLKAVEEGVNVVAETALILKSIVSSTHKTSKIIVGISTSCTKQEESMNHISLGVDQISSVVQGNAVTAEESALASEELTYQATSLKELVSDFKLKE